VLISTADDLPIGATVCGGNRQDATFTAETLSGVMIEPAACCSRPIPQAAGRRSNGKQSTVQLLALNRELLSDPDVRAMPYLRGDGSFARIPARCQAKQQGFRLWAPKRGESRQGLGRIRSSVERAHALVNQFGRVMRRLDRSGKRYLGWVHLACCIIFMRQGFFP
jgi:hypothetical protein